MSAELRLATYGTLAPGRVNHDQLSDLEGTWTTGVIKGTLIEEGWGAELGYPGMALGEEGQDIEVFIFESSDLPNHWQRLDAFEGDGYVRQTTLAQTENGMIDVSVYVINQQ